MMKKNRVNRILKKALSIAIIGGFISSLNVYDTKALDSFNVPEYIKVGLETVSKGVYTQNINNNSLYIGTYSNDYFKEFANLQSDNGFVASAGSGAFVSINTNMSFSQAQEVANGLEAKELNAYPVFLGQGYDSNTGFTVYISNTSLEEVITLTEYESSIDVPWTEAFKIEGSSNKLLIPVSTEGVLRGNGNDNTFEINHKSFRGYLSFGVSGSLLTAINVIDVDDYLYGVLPVEMSVSYSEEALKSQAVAARSYAMTKLGSHAGGNYSACDTVHCQVYAGYNVENPKTNSAVDSTQGEILIYNGKPIQAFFFASSGGYTDNSEDVWVEAVPYLRAVPEIAVEENATWTREYTSEQISSMVGGVGIVEDIVITKLATGGRIQEIQVLGSDGVRTIDKNSIRSVFSDLPSKMFNINGLGGTIGQYNGIYNSSGSAFIQGGNNDDFLYVAASQGITIKADGDLAHLNGKVVEVEYEGVTTDLVPSSGAFTPVDMPDYAQNVNGYEIQDVSISTANEEGGYLFEGAGNGHGIGMSQKGAEAMAKLGYTYDQILTHYYTGVSIYK